MATLTGGPAVGRPNMWRPLDDPETLSRCVRPKISTCQLNGPTVENLVRTTLLRVARAEPARGSGTRATTPCASPPAAALVGSHQLCQRQDAFFAKPTDASLGEPTKDHSRVLDPDSARERRRVPRRWAETRQTRPESLIHSDGYWRQSTGRQRQAGGDRRACLYSAGSPPRTSPLSERP